MKQQKQAGKKNRVKGNHKLLLTLLFTVSVGVLIWLTTITALFTAKVLRDSPLFEVGHVPQHTLGYIFCILCVIIGSVFAALFSRTVLRPLLHLMDAFDQVSAGNYTVRVSTKGFLRLMKVGERFNKMVEQLGNVEILQNEFIDNFSHEFKTPLSSMNGFAELLKQDNLLPEQRKEYADIISSESMRLSKLSTTVLLLSKVEKQAILTNISSCNIAEQLRRCVALLDTAWNDKGLEILLNTREVFVPGNENLLAEVWLNLLDNAVKFSDDNTPLQIDIDERESTVHVTISNTGAVMSDVTKERLFDKFYQQDTAHATKGYGLGLAIVKKVIDLHRGEIVVSSSDEYATVITVILKKDLSA